MIKFQDEDITLPVSQFCDDGWWLGNVDEYVSKGTALGEEYTETIYEPSQEGMIGRYDKSTDTWAETKNNALTEFYDEHGEGFVVGTPDGEVPEWGITEKPPTFDYEKQTIRYFDKKWNFFDLEIDKPYYNEYGDEFLVDTVEFELPENHTFTKPPEKIEGFANVLNDGDWSVVEDYRGKIAYNKQTQDEILIETVGEIDAEYTLKKPNHVIDMWNGEEWFTDLDKKYDFDVNAVNRIRRAQYSERVDPLMAEARIKRLQGFEENATELETQALQERANIQIEHSHPVK